MTVKAIWMRTEGDSWTSHGYQLQNLRECGMMQVPPSLSQQCSSDALGLHQWAGSCLPLKPP